MRKAIAIISVILFLLFDFGCKKVPLDISKSLNSTNGVFRTNFSDTILLSTEQLVRIKRIIARFNNPSEVQIRKDILPYESGRFIVGGIHFGWLGRILYWHDLEGSRYYVVEDAALAKLSEALREAQGQKTPLKTPSREQWQKILLVLENEK